MQVLGIVGKKVVLTYPEENIDTIEYDNASNLKVGQRIYFGPDGEYDPKLKAEVIETVATTSNSQSPLSLPKIKILVINTQALYDYHIVRKNIIATDSLIFEGRPEGPSVIYRNKIKKNKAGTMLIIYSGNNYEGTLLELLDLTSNIIYNMLLEDKVPSYKDIPRRIN